MTLAQALQAARTNAPALRAARATTRAAQAHVAVSRAPLLPQVVGTANYQRTTANFVPRPGAVPQSLTSNPSQARAPSFRTFDFYNLSATASQVVYDFGVLGGVLSASKENAKAQGELERATALDVELEVRTAFFQARASKELAAVAQAALVNLQKHEAHAEALVQVGTRPAIDVAQARTDVANARVTQIRAENDYAIARARLNQAMGIEGSTDYEVSDEQLPALALEQADATTLLAQAFEQRADLAALDRQLRAQEHTERGIKGAYGPSVSVSTTLSKAGTDTSDLIWNWNAGVLLSWPLLSGGGTLAQSREAQAVFESLAAQRDALRQEVRLELERAQRNVGAAKAVIEAADQAVASARQRLELAEGRYDAGVGNIIELGDAQLAFTNAQAQRVSADYELSTARAILLNALGQAE